MAGFGAKNKPITEEDRERVRKLHATLAREGHRREAINIIHARLGISPDAIRKIVKEMERDSQ